MKSLKNIVFRILGITLVIIGILLIAYPIYTNYVSRRRQEELLSLWEEQEKFIQVSVIETSKEKTEDEKPEKETEEEKPEEETTELEVIELPELGEAFGTIEIPAIDLRGIIYEGTEKPILKNWPGHIVGTAIPGRVGTCAISGHRTTYGAPFNKLDELLTGDEIIIETNYGEFTYILSELKIVEPTDVYILEPTLYTRLILTSCHPKYSAAKRLIAFAYLEGYDPADYETKFLDKYEKLK